ncbi:MAG: XRE family transcriptional regulator [Chloroflexota bacterium]|nr:XRE family transcriptional regulator [Chloroflexota bacterium]
MTDTLLPSQFGYPPDDLAEPAEPVPVIPADLAPVIPANLAPVIPDADVLANRSQTMARQLGGRIRELRLQRHLTLKRMADSTGLSVAMLSLVERGQSNPSIGSLVAICDALSTSMSDLFDGLGHKSSGTVVRRADQLVYMTDEGVRRRILLNLARYGVEFAENEYAPGTKSAASPVHHAGAEFGILLSGSLEVHIDTATYVLEPFDVIHFESNRPHLFVNPGAEPARALWVNLHHLPETSP